MYVAARVSLCEKGLLHEWVFPSHDTWSKNANSVNDGMVEYLEAPVYPICLQAESADSFEKLFEHKFPQIPFIANCKVPEEGLSDVAFVSHTSISSGIVHRGSH